MVWVKLVMMRMLCCQRKSGREVFLSLSNWGFGWVKAGQTHTPLPSEVLRGGRRAKHTEEDLGEQYISRARQLRANYEEAVGV